MTLGKRKSLHTFQVFPEYRITLSGMRRQGLRILIFNKIVVLDFRVERMKEIGMLTFEQLRMGVILEERVVEPSVPELKGQMSFECGSWDGQLYTCLVTMWELTKPL